MSEKKLAGSCLCGEVKFEVSGPFKAFQYCHCSRCQKVTGSAHASNIFVAPEQLTWLQGEENVGRFEVEDAKYFATCFCKKCGSSLPWLTQPKNNLIIPAGSLDDELDIKPEQSIYWGSKACWYLSPSELPVHDELPTKKT